jgi:hypothetical protein
MGSPCSCAIAPQHDHLAAVPQGNRIGADHVQVCPGEELAISPIALPPPPLLTVDHVVDIYHNTSTLTSFSESVTEVLFTIQEVKLF